MVTPIAHVFFRAFFGFAFGLASFYFLIWGILASTVPDIEGIIRFGICTLLSGLTSVYFVLIYRKSDLFLPKGQSMAFYSAMALLSLLTGTLLFFHIESWSWIEDRMQLPPQILAVVVYLVFFIFALIRASEARFLPSSPKARESDELIK
ncbi:MAG: hypothetical protein KJT03_07285 [Verrucomicrobiae bacterium]|nr:hypothetical protein [Verrucomicrobiae bacterium]